MNIKGIIFSVLIFISLALGYYFSGGWWKFSSSTLLILALTFTFYPSRWREYLGINKPGALGWGLAVVVCVTLYFTSEFLITSAIESQGYFLKKGEKIDYFLVPFQTLNEELVFRALLLSAFLSLGFGKWKIILGLSFVFTVFHWIFYHFNMLPSNRGDVELSALLTLFFFGVATTSLFLATRSIAMPWALHCGWNFNRFGSKLTSFDNSEARVEEYLTFNLLEGSWSIVFLSALLAFGCLFYLQKSVAKDSRI